MFASYGSQRTRDQSIGLQYRSRVEQIGPTAEFRDCFNRFKSDLRDSGEGRNGAIEGESIALAQINLIAKTLLEQADNRYRYENSSLLRKLDKKNQNDFRGRSRTDCRGSDFGGR